MITYTYKPDEEKIKQRSTIKMFGEVAHSFIGKTYSSKLPAPKFHLQDEPQEKADVYQYVPTFQSKTDYMMPTKNMPFTLRVCNIPKSLSKREFIDIIASKLENPIFYCNMANDREKGTFTGVSYLKFDNEEIARKAMKVLDGVQIGDCLIGVDIAKRQY